MSEELPVEAQNKIVVFGAKRIRRIWHEEQWYFSIIDVVAALTDSADPKQYIKKMRQRDPELDAYWGTVRTPLDLPAPDGKIRKSNCANEVRQASCHAAELLGRQAQARAAGPTARGVMRVPAEWKSS
jgi:prophage antirepressor-like protein